MSAGMGEIRDVCLETFALGLKEIKADALEVGVGADPRCLGGSQD